MHHWVTRESTGTDPDTVLAGGAFYAALRCSSLTLDGWALLSGRWPERFGSGVYASLAEQGLSFSAGPCNSLPQSRGGGAEWRGVGAQLASRPFTDKPEMAWVFDGDIATWGLNLHLIDLRGVDRCGSWEGNHWTYPAFPGTPIPGPYPCGNVSLMTGVSQCIQCNCAYLALNNNGLVTSTTPLTGGLGCCSDGVFCDLGGKFTAQDGGVLWPESRRRQFSTAIMPDGEPWELTYTYRYTITFTAYSEGTRALMQSLFVVESASEPDSNGFDCDVEYMAPTCGACAGKSCGAVKDFYSSVISGVYGPGAEGYEGGSAPSETAPWSSLSECEVDKDREVVVTKLSYSWTITTDIDVSHANGHLHMGGLSLRIYVSGGGSESRMLLCESLPTYAPAGDPQAGFIVNMTLCDWRSAPVRLSAGTVLTVESTYWADSEAPFPMPGGEPHWAQMPWTGAMGYAFVNWALAPGAKFAWFTTTGAQPFALSARGRKGDDL